MVNVLAIVPKVCGFKPGRSNGFLRAINILFFLSCCRFQTVNTVLHAFVTNQP
jgi:hypothetical protein